MAVTLAVSVSLGVLVGCGDDDSAETGSMSSTGVDSEGTASTPTGASPMTLGDSTAATSMGSDPTAGPTPDTTQGEGTSTSGETAGAQCDGLDRKECTTTEGCMPIAGTPILMMGDGVCLGGPEFIECQPTTGCGGAITYACAGDDAMNYEFMNTCIPLGWVSCGNPPGPLRPCPE